MTEQLCEANRIFLMLVTECLYLSIDKLAIIPYSLGGSASYLALCYFNIWFSLLPCFRKTLNIFYK